MNEEITDVKPPMGFPHITDLAGSEATILQVANSQGDILGYATLDDIDAYIEQKVSETVHSFSQKQTFQDVTINGTFDGNNVINPDKLNSALSTFFKGNNVIGNNSDCNNIADGFYNYTYPNFPANVDGVNGVLMQLSRGGIKIQFKYDWNANALSYRRTDFNGNWQIWKNLHTNM